MNRIELAVQELNATFAEIAAKVRAVPTPWLTWRPSPDVWSILDNLCLIEEFTPYWTGQIRNMVTNPDGEWGRTHADPIRLAAVTDTSDRALGTC